MIRKKIREVLESTSLDMADKLWEIEKLLTKKRETIIAEIFGSKCEMRKEGNIIIFDGSIGCQYIYNPVLKNEDDLYYSGAGCTWGIDINGSRYWKRHDPCMIDKTLGGNRYAHLNPGDIIDEKVRIKKLIIECLNELQMSPMWLDYYGHQFI